MTDIERQTEIYRELRSRARDLIEQSLLDECKDETSTKYHLVNPLIQLLGYVGRDVELEHPIDAVDGKVDYALKREGEPLVLVEAKKLGHALGRTEVNQLAKYFPHSEARYGLLTDGTRCRWFKKQTNRDIIDPEPFLEHDALKPSKMESEWLAAVSRDAFDGDDLEHLSTRMRVETRLHQWLIGTFVRPAEDDANLRRLRNALDLKRVDLDLLREAANCSWCRVLSDHSAKVDPAGDNNDLSQDVDISIARTSGITYVERTENRLDPGDGDILYAKYRPRAWRVGDGEWNVEADGVRLVANVLEFLLGLDVRCEDEPTLASLHGSIVYPESTPDSKASLEK